ncbi:hypothetical protein RFI_17322, partial [Reticulomyxa filosa]
MTLCVFLFFTYTRVKLQIVQKKEALLTDLTDFISQNTWFSEELFEECLKTISINLFRPLPYQYRPPSLMFFNDEVFEKETSYEDPSWRHLKLVYDLTWRVINTPSVTAQIMEIMWRRKQGGRERGGEKNKTNAPTIRTHNMKNDQKYLPGSFLQKLMELFASEDTRERAYLMMILHKIYGRCLKLRPHIIELICVHLYRVMYTPDLDHCNGVIEILQIVCAIIPGLTLPIKDTWQNVLLFKLDLCENVVSRALKKYWEQLTQCCVNYVAKDIQGASVVLSGLLRYWPKQSPQKEEIFIMEAVNIIDVLIHHQNGHFDFDTFKPILVATSHQLIKCMLSTRQPVAEHAIAAWKEPSMQELVDFDRKAFLPQLMEAFFRNRSHPNQQLRTSSQSVETIYQNKDILYWKKMQQYLTKKQTREQSAEDTTTQALANGGLPPFPCKVNRSRLDTESQSTESTKPISSIINGSSIFASLKKTDGMSNIPSPNNNTDNANSSKPRGYDSFVIFTLEQINKIDYSPLIPSVRRYEQDVADNKFRYLTKTEQQVHLFF